MYNAFMSTNPKCKLRQKEGYVKSTNVGGTGRKGYIRSVAMTARNVEECRERSDHRAEQRQEHATSGGRTTAQSNRIPPGPAPDPELKMDGIDEVNMSYKWFSCTVATPGRHMPTSFYTLLKRWILTTAAILKAFLVVEIGEDKHGFTASAKRNGTGRGRGGGRGRGRGRSGAFGGPDDEMNNEVGWRHCHFMLLFNCPDGFDSVLTTVVKNLIHPIAAQMATHFCIKEFGYGQTPTLQAGYLQKDKGKDHFESTAKGITAQELENAITAYDKKKLTFWAGKQELHKQSLFTDCYRWFTRMYPGQYPPSFIDVIVMMIRTGEYYPSQQWVLLPTGITSPAKAQAMWHLMFRPHTCTRRDVMIIFFTDIKGSLYRSEIENVIDQLCSKMGPQENEDTCNAKQPAADSDLNDDENDSHLNIGTNVPEHFTDDEHETAQFAEGTDAPPPTRPFRRPPLSAFTIRRFGLAGFDEPVGLVHRIDPPVNLEEFYGFHADDLSIVSFSTNDGNSDGHADVDGENDSIYSANDDDGSEHGDSDDDEYDNENDDNDDDDNDDEDDDNDDDDDDEV